MTALAILVGLTFALNVLALANHVRMFARGPAPDVARRRSWWVAGGLALVSRIVVVASLALAYHVLRNGGPA